MAPGTVSSRPLVGAQLQHRGFARDGFDCGKQASVSAGARQATNGNLSMSRDAYAISSIPIVFTPTCYSGDGEGVGALVLPVGRKIVR